MYFLAVFFAPVSFYAAFHIKETSFVYQKDKRGFLVFIGSVWYNHLNKSQTAERLNRKEKTHGS